MILKSSIVADRCEIAMKCFLWFCVIAVAAEDCENDELQLLQRHDKFPDWSKIMEAGASAADAMTGGIGTLTSKIGESLTDLDDQVLKAEKTFNASLSQFHGALNAASTLSQNLTAFKGLISSTLEKYVPFYSSAKDQVQNAVKTTQTVAEMMGQKDLTDKLKALNQTVVEKLGDLAESSEALASEITETTEEKYGDILEDVKGKLDSIVYTTGSFRKSFNQRLEAFTEAVKGPMEIGLGSEASEEILKLKTKAQKMVMDLDSFAKIVKIGLAGAADSVDTQVAIVKKKGFWRRIFGGLFR